MSRHVKNLNDENLARRITKREHCINSAPGSFAATFRAPCSSVTTFPVTLRPVHPERLHPAHIARCDSFFLKRPRSSRPAEHPDRLSFSVPRCPLTHPALSTLLHPEAFLVTPSWRVLLKRHHPDVRFVVRLLSTKIESPVSPLSYKTLTDNTLSKFSYESAQNILISCFI